MRKKYIWFIYDFNPTLAKKETRWSVREPMYHARKHKDTRTKLTEEERKDGVFHDEPFAISQAICMSSRDKSWISEGKIRGYFDPLTFVCSFDRLPKGKFLSPSFPVVLVLSIHPTEKTVPPTKMSVYPCWHSNTGWLKMVFAPKIGPKKVCKSRQRQAE